VTSPPQASPRVRRLGSAGPRADGRYVLYWMIATRRCTHNAALERAVQWCRALGLPLLVCEPLELDYPFASERFHRFILDGMHDNAAACAAAGVRYFPWVEPRVGAGAGLLQALAAEAAVVVTDDSPAFFLPRLLAAAARALPRGLEAVDSVGLLPVASPGRAFSAAVHFRRALQTAFQADALAPSAARPLASLPSAGPLAPLPAGFAERWPAADPALLRPGAHLGTLALDRGVPPVPGAQGGRRAAQAALDRFLARGLHRYAEHARHPDEDACSELSAYLHFGHLGTEEVFAALVAAEGAETDTLGQAAARGQREGFWGLSAAAESFVDQLVTWRELGHNGARWLPDYRSYASLPDWARATLERHAADPRPVLYSREALERAETADPLWNAAQRQLRQEGRIHNYLRMLWGKRILEWSPEPAEAFERMLWLNDRWALDGRDPNSVSGIAWVLGRYDRAWGPERSIFGTVRYMSSANTQRKLRLAAYLRRFGGEAGV